MKNTDMFYRKRITFVRMMNGMSMQDLADKLGLSKQAISKFETGDLKPSYVVMLGICKIFNLPNNFFIEKKINLSLNENKIEITPDEPKK